MYERCQRKAKFGASCASDTKEKQHNIQGETHTRKTGRDTRTKDKEREDRIISLTTRSKKAVFYKSAKIKAFYLDFFLHVC